MKAPTIGQSKSPFKVISKVLKRSNEEANERQSQDPMKGQILVP